MLKVFLPFNLSVLKMWHAKVNTLNSGNLGCPKIVLAAYFLSRPKQTWPFKLVYVSVSLRYVYLLET